MVFFMKWDFRVFGKKVLEFRGANPENPAFSLSNPNDEFVKFIFGGVGTISGEQVNEQTAMKFSAVFAGVDLVATTIASLAFDVRERDQSGNTRIATDHYLQYLIHDEPNPIMTSYWLRKILVQMAMLWGNGYAEIVRNANYKIQEIKIHHAALVTPRKVDGKIWYFIDGRDEPVSSLDMIHVFFWTDDGIKGKSLIHFASESIGTGLAMQKFSARFFKNGANLKTVLETDQVLKDAVYTRVKDSWRENQEGAENSFNTPILEGGLKAKAIGVDPEAAQLIASRKFQLSEVARVLHIPLHKLSDLDRATNNNIEHQSIEFVQDSIRPWCKQLEQEYNRKIFQETERGRLSVRLNIDSLLRGDINTRSEFYSKMFSIAVFCPNDILRMEGKNTYEGGDERYVQGAYVPVSMIKEKYQADILKRVQQQSKTKNED